MAFIYGIQKMILMCNKCRSSTCKSLNQFSSLINTWCYVTQKLTVRWSPAMNYELWSDFSLPILPFPWHSNILISTRQSDTNWVFLRLCVCICSRDHYVNRLISVVFTIITLGGFAPDKIQMLSNFDKCVCVCVWVSLYMTSFSMVPMRPSFLRQKSLVMYSICLSVRLSRPIHLSREVE